MKNNVKFVFDYSLVLIFFAYITIFIQRNPEESSSLLSMEGVVVLIIILGLQIISNFIIYFSNKIWIKFIYVNSLIFLYLFFNLSFFFIVTEQINFITNGLIRARFLFIFLAIFIFFISYFLSGKFNFFLRFFRIFLCLFIITSLPFIQFNLVQDGFDSNDLIFSSEEAVDSKKLNFSNGSEFKKKNILLIILDGYSPESVILPFSNRDSITSLNSFLREKKFIIFPEIPSREITTEKSLNELFNQGLTREIRENLKKRNSFDELKSSYVHKTMNKAGFLFKNFGIFNIGGVKEFSYVYPYARNKYEFFLKNSMWPEIGRHLTKNSFYNFSNSHPYADHNKLVFNESINFLNNLDSSRNQFTYVHFIMPHPPYFSSGEFKRLSPNLNNYIKYWSFTNIKIIDYLKSIENIEKLKIIITGDHGYRADHDLIDPHMTMASFYNFSSSELKKVSDVQSIGELLLIQ